ncbi:hypothetical protein GCM10020000_81420 [Streptomyces olivoverticillatus]
MLRGVDGGFAVQQEAVEDVVRVRAADVRRAIEGGAAGPLVLGQAQERGERLLGEGQLFGDVLHHVAGYLLHQPVEGGELVGIGEHAVPGELALTEDPLVVRGHESESGALLIRGLSRVVPPLREPLQHLLPCGEDGFPGGLAKHPGNRLGDVVLELLHTQHYGFAGQLAEQHAQPVVDGMAEAVPCRGVDVKRLYRVRQPGQAGEVVAADGFHAGQVPSGGKR